MPPTGERKQWTTRKGRFLPETATPPSEQALTYIDRIAGKQRVGCYDPSRHHLAVDVAGDVHIALIGAGSEAAGRRDRLLHGHAGHVGILSGVSDLAHHEDGPVARHPH